MSSHESTSEQPQSDDEEKTDVEDEELEDEEEEDSDDELDDLDDLDYDLPDELLEEEANLVSADGDDPNCMYGFDGYKWSIYPTTTQRKTAGDEIFPELKGTAKTAVFTDANQIWDLLFTPEMIDRIVAGTNREIEAHLNETEYKKTPSLTHASEMRALFGVLYLIAAYKNKNEDLSGLWASDGTGRVIFSTAMSNNRLLFLLKHLRLDDSRRDDQMPDLVRLYEQFFANSRNNFSAGEYLTVDHGLTKGKTKLLVSNNPNNRVYGRSPGLRTYFVTDSMTSYVLNGHITGDTIDASFAELSKPTQVVLQLITPLDYRDRNITAGPWYTSIEMAYELQSRGYSYVGPMLPKQRQMPRDFVLKSRKRAVGSALYAFNRQTTVVSFMAKRNAPVVILSTMHNQPKSENGKPEIYQFYEASKAAIAAVEKEASVRAVYKGRRWEIDLLLQLVDFAGINAHQIFQMTLGEAKHRDFIIALGRSLIMPELERRSQLHLSRDLREAIYKVCGCDLAAKAEEDAEEDEPMSARKKRRCQFCPRSRDTKIKTICSGCKRPACRRCLSNLCEDCSRTS